MSALKTAAAVTACLANPADDTAAEAVGALYAKGALPFDAETCRAWGDHIMEASTPAIPDAWWDLNPDILEGVITALERRCRADFLTALDTDKFPKQARKTVRKALHKLRSKGIAAPAIEPRVGTVGEVTPGFEPFAFVSVDGYGLVAATTIVLPMFGRAYVTNVALLMPAMLIEYTAFEVAESFALYKLVSDINNWAEGDYTSSKVPLAVARHLVESALKTQEFKPVPKISDKRFLWPDLALLLPPEAPYPIEIPEAEARCLAAQRPPWLSSLNPDAPAAPLPAPHPRETKELFVYKLTQIINSKIITGEAQRKALFNETLDRLVAEHLPSLRAAIAMGWEITAVCEHYAGRTGNARWLRASAQALREDWLAVHEFPALQAAYRQAFDYVDTARGNHSHAETETETETAIHAPSLIVRP